MCSPPLPVAVDDPAQDPATTPAEREVEERQELGRELHRILTGGGPEEPSTTREQSEPR